MCDDDLMPQLVACYETRASWLPLCEKCRSPGCEGCLSLRRHRLRTHKHHTHSTTRLRPRVPLSCRCIFRQAMRAEWWRTCVPRKRLKSALPSSLDWSVITALSLTSTLTLSPSQPSVTVSPYSTPHTAHTAQPSLSPASALLAPRGFFLSPCVWPLHVGLWVCVSDLPDLRANGLEHAVVEVLHDWRWHSLHCSESIYHLSGPHPSSELEVERLAALGLHQATVVRRVLQHTAHTAPEGETNPRGCGTPTMAVEGPC